MAELTAADLSTFTGGRLPNNSATTDLLNAALAAARRWCGWHVSPVLTGDVVDMDGPGGQVLSLPTLNLTAVTGLTENGVAVDVTKVDVSRRKGCVYKQSGRCWSNRFGAISATITHGFTELEAADWRRAVLELADRMSKQESSERDTDDMIMKQIDDVQYQWAAGIISTDQRLSGLFSQFRILPLP